MLAAVSRAELTGEGVEAGDKKRRDDGQEEAEEGAREFEEEGLQTRRREAGESDVVVRHSQCLRERLFLVASRSLFPYDGTQLAARKVHQAKRCKELQARITKAYVPKHQ